MIVNKFYAPGWKALGRLLREYNNAGLDIHGLVVEATYERGDAPQREAAIEFMKKEGWPTL